MTATEDTAAAPFSVGQPVEVNTRYLATEPDQWEPATVYATGGRLGTRNIEVEYAAGGVAAVAVNRVRLPLEPSTIQLLDQLAREQLELCGCGQPAADMAHDPWTAGGHQFGDFVPSPAALVAQRLLNLANQLSAEPLAGSGKDFTELGEQLARDTVEVLAHYMLMHPELEPQFPGVARAATSWQAWQDFGS